MRSLRIAASRAALRVAYRVLQVYWSVARPRKRGVKCVLTRGGEVLLVRHSYGDRYAWELPGGAVKRGEQPRAAAIRETREELGVVLSDWTPLAELPARINRRRDTLCCFHARLDGVQPELDPVEILELGWFDPRRLPDHVGPHVEEVIVLARRVVAL